MSNIKKIIGVVLALVMALSVASIAFAAEDDYYEISFNVVDGKTELAPGDSTTIEVNLTTNFYASAISIPIFFDNSQVDVVATSKLAKDEDQAERVNIADDNSDPDAIKKFYESVPHTPDTASLRAFVYVGKYYDKLYKYDNYTVMTLTVTAKDNAKSGVVIFDCIEDAIKTSTHPSGALYVAKNGSGNAEVDSKGEVIDDARIKEAVANITIKGGSEPADLAIKSAYSDSGIVIDRNKTFDGKYAGVVYGFDLEATINVAYYEARLEATNNGTITVVKTPYVARPVSYGTGATVEVRSSDGTLEKTYVIVIFGDVSGNGKIGAEDTGAIYNHVQGKTLITDEVQVMAANVIESGRTPALKAQSLYQIKADDTGVVYNAVQGTGEIDQAALAASHNSYNTYYQ